MRQKEEHAHGLGLGALCRIGEVMAKARKAKQITKGQERYIREFLYGMDRCGIRQKNRLNPIKAIIRMGRAAEGYFLNRTGDWIDIDEDKTKAEGLGFLPRQILADPHFDAARYSRGYIQDGNQAGSEHLRLLMCVTYIGTICKRMGCNMANIGWALLMWEGHLQKDAEEAAKAKSA